MIKDRKRVSCGIGSGRGKERLPLMERKRREHSYLRTTEVNEVKSMKFTSKVSDTISDVMQHEQAHFNGFSVSAGVPKKKVLKIYRQF
jgi:hypothetical protein